MLNRRGFIGVMAAIVGAPRVEARAVPSGPLINNEALRRFSRAFRDEWRALTHAEPQIDESLTWGRLTHQINAGYSADDARLGYENPALVAKALERMARCMARTAYEEGIGVFAPLILPKAVVFAGHALPVRHVRVWDPVVSSMIVRFDVLGKQTHEPRPDTMNRPRYSSIGMAWSPVNLWAFER